jgi:hypothetical protein
MSDHAASPTTTTISDAVTASGFRGQNSARRCPTVEVGGALYLKSPGNGPAFRTAQLTFSSIRFSCIRRPINSFLITHNPQP